MTATHGEGAYGNAVGVTTPTDHKMAQVAEFVKTAANTIRPGLLWDGNATVVSGKANMSYDVRAFSIVTSRGATSGAMKWANDATVNVVTTAAPGSNSRYDVVYAWHREYAIDGSNSDPVIGVIQGTAAASPTVPALTSFPGAVELARILVPAGVTATNSGTTITQTAPFTATAGGVIPFRNSTERDAGSYIENQLGWLLDSHLLQSYSGSGWAAVGPVINHAEYTFTVSSLADATSFTAFAFTAVSGQTTGSAFSSIVSNKLRLPAGLYSISAFGTSSANFTGRSFLTLSTAGIVAQETQYAGEANINVNHPNLYLTAQTDITVTLFKTAGGSSNFSGTLRVTKLG